MNECKGCIYDLTDRVAKSGDELIEIMDRCTDCKREKLDEYKDIYEDLYRNK